MKLLFIGVKPSQAFQKTVISHGFSCTTLGSLSELAKWEAHELVVLSVKRIEDLQHVEIIKKKVPRSWLALVVRKSLLNRPEIQSSLLECEEKNAIWLEESWEMMFWFSYQQMLEFVKVSQQVEELNREISKYREKTSSIADVSNKLLDKFKKDLDLAENIQRALRPRFSPHIPGISLSVKYIPSLGGGGDYYDVFEFGDKKRFGILLAESNNHGLAAALLTVLLKLRVEEMKNRFPDSRSLVSFLNREIRAIHNKSGTSMSLLYGILDRASLTFQYTSAGPLAPILWREGKATPVRESVSPRIGDADHFEFPEDMILLQPGDLLILHTQGLELPIKRRHIGGVVDLLKNLSKNKVGPEPLKVQNELMGLIDEHLAKKKLKEDVTLIQLAVDERAMYVAQVEGTQSK